jgi:hypothetical protein
LLHYRFLRNSLQRFGLLHCRFLFALLLLHVTNSLHAQPEDCRNPYSLSGPQYQKLWQDFETLSSEQMQGRRPGTEGAKLARAFIIDQFKKAGLQTLKESNIVKSQPELFDQGGWLHLFKPGRFSKEKKGANIVAVLKGSNPGQSKNSKAIVITAHYDHLGRQQGRIHYGANDNASGVAAMLFLARALQKDPLLHHVVFVATDYEEAGLFGSKAFVKDHVLPKDKILLNVNIDMIAQPGREWRLYVSGTRSQPHLKSPVERIIAKAPICVKTGLDSPSWDYDRRHRVDWRRASDHWAFVRQDIPWLYIGVKDYRYYHTPRDTTEKIPPEFYFGVVTAINQLITTLDGYFSTPESDYLQTD